MVIRDDYGPWTASTLRLSSEILLGSSCTSSVFARKHTVGKVDTLPFRAAIGDPQAGLGRSSYPPDLESRSMTSFLGRA